MTKHPFSLQTLKRHHSRAVAERVHPDIQLIENRQQEIRHRRLGSVPKMTAPLQFARSPADNKQWKRFMVVLIAVAHRAAVQQDGMIEQVTVAIRRGLQLIEQIGEDADVVAIQNGKAVHVFTLVRMVRQRVERIANGAVGISGTAEFLRHEQGSYTRDIRLPGEHLQVEQQLDVGFKIRRNADGSRGQLQIR